VRKNRVILLSHNHRVILGCEACFLVDSRGRIRCVRGRVRLCARIIVWLRSYCVCP